MQTVSQNYTRVIEAAGAEVNRLLPTPDYNGSSRGKAQAIMNALDRLYLMVVKKYPTADIPFRHTILTQINHEEASDIDLRTMSAMLDARISQWQSEIPASTEYGMDFNGRRAGYRTQISLREALNIATNNIFNSSLGTLGPLWGKATALENVERKLELHDTESSCS